MRYLLVFGMWCLVVGCARREWPQFSAADTLRVGAGHAPPLHKIKARTVILQTGTGNVASTTDNTKAGQRGGAAATAPGASATASTTGISWRLLAAVVVLALLLGAGAWEYLSHAGLLRGLPWRSR